MEIKRGIPVSPGVAIGPALVLDTEGFRISRRSVRRDQVKDELQRLRQASGGSRGTLMAARGDEPAGEGTP